MTTTQAAKILGCDQSSVRRMIREGVFKKDKLTKLKYPNRASFAYDIAQDEVMRVKKLVKSEKRGYPRGRTRTK